MKAHLYGAVVALLCIIVASCSAQTDREHPSKSVLDRHRRFSSYTDPGRYAYLYDDLPQSLNDLCALIKRQLIHPFDAAKFAIPEDRMHEDRNFPTVELMLAELLKRDENGLVTSREPRDRLVVACVHHSMLLASVLRHRGIPVRIRAGFAKYIGGDGKLRVSHVVCEVWDRERKRWILVDADRQKIDFLRHEFEFAHETWSRLRNGNLGDEKYLSRLGTVDRATVHLLCHDLFYIIGTEEPYWEDPPIVSRIESSIADLSEIELEVLDTIAKYLSGPDQHIDDLIGMREESPFIRLAEER